MVGEEGGKTKPETMEGKKKKRGNERKVTSKAKKRHVIDEDSTLLQIIEIPEKEEGKKKTFCLRGKNKSIIPSSRNHRQLSKYREREREYLEKTRRDSERHHHLNRHPSL